MGKIRNQKKKLLFQFLLALGGLFALFICLCGNTHTLNVLKFIYPNMGSVDVAIEIMLWLCAGVSVITAIVGIRLFPLILEILAKFELNSEGNLEHAENYLLEVVEMVKESIMVINDDCVVEKCNEASKVLFGKDIVGKNVKHYIHPEDAETFHQAIMRVMGSYNFAPITVEYRIKVVREELDFFSDAPIAAIKLPTSADVRVHCDIDMSLYNEGMPDFSADTVNMALNALASRAGDRDIEYIWIESTICKGMRLTQSDDLEYDLKMASRNIEERKRKGTTATVSAHPPHPRG
jgi:PAS domain-containing protein